MVSFGSFQLRGGERIGSGDVNEAVSLGTSIPEDLFS